VNGGPPQNVLVDPHAVFANYEKRVKELMTENDTLKEKMKYLEGKISTLITAKIAEKKAEKKMELPKPPEVINI
jgi:hypothetical protein